MENMNKSTKAVLIFLVVLVVLFWMMPNQKIEIIGDFFEKILKPISIPLSGIIGVTFFGIKKYMQPKNKDEL